MYPDLKTIDVEGECAGHFLSTTGRTEGYQVDVVKRIETGFTR